MKNILSGILMLLTLNSCKVTSNRNDSFDGVYYSKGKDYEYQLVLQRDSTFEFDDKSLEVKSGCKGKWLLKNLYLIILNCDEPKTITETLQGGYISDRVMKVTIKNKNELLFGKVVLKKKQ